MQDLPHGIRVTIAKKLLLQRLLTAHFNFNVDRIARTQNRDEERWKERAEEGYPELRDAFERIMARVRHSMRPYVEANLATARAIDPDDAPTRRDPTAKPLAQHPRIRWNTALAALGAQRAVRVELRAYIARQRHALPDLPATLGPRVERLARAAEPLVADRPLPHRGPRGRADRHVEELAPLLRRVVFRPVEHATWYALRQKRERQGRAPLRRAVLPLAAAVDRDPRAGVRRLDRLIPVGPPAARSAVAARAVVADYAWLVYRRRGAAHDHHFPADVNRDVRPPFVEGHSAPTTFAVPAILRPLGTTGARERERAESGE